MARPRTIDDDQILDAARAVFLADGRGAPTSAVAQRAGVSEGTIFKRFGSKDGLFFAAMAVPDPTEVVALARRPVAVGQERARFEALGLALVGFFRDVLPRMMCSRLHPHFSPELMLQGETPPPAQVIGALTELVERCVATGSMRTDSPEVVARALVGTMHNYVFLEWMRVPQLPGQVGPDTADFVRRFVTMLWDGAGAPGTAAREAP